jgi:type IV secretory pathway VirB2 component (pilin)
MTFRQMNQTYLVPLAQIVMIFGIVALCQPWIEVLHRYGLTITLIGLVAFLVVMHIAPEPEAAIDDEEDRV